MAHEIPDEIEMRRRSGLGVLWPPAGSEQRAATLFPFAGEMTALKRRASAALQAAGLDTDEYVSIDVPSARKACLDGRFTAAELRTIADVMDALAKEKT